MNDFPSRLKALRRGRNLTQSELAHNLGLSKSSVNMYEHGEREPGLATLRMLADFFYVDADYLLGRSDCFAANAGLPPSDPLVSVMNAYQYALDELKAAQQTYNHMLYRIFTATSSEPLRKEPALDFSGDADAFCTYFQLIMRRMTEAERHDLRHKILTAMDTARENLKNTDAHPDSAEERTSPQDRHPDNFLPGNEESCCG